MRCLVCEGWSWVLICSSCQEHLLTPTPRRRQLLPDFPVYSFYGYSEIEPLIKTKELQIGWEVFTILAARSFRPFAQAHPIEAFAIPIDDRIDKGWSHTAILARALKSSTIKPRYATLQAGSRVRYTGKDRSFRLQNPRRFRYTGPKAPIILVDDVLTTGTTLQEAYQVARGAGALPLFGLVLADARW
ncbi:MAG: ComF family protein [Nitratiruptor sp.]|nr:ComF family protein [Nitratiruptor sp.]NPA82884.1 ComF family protein [Campylobacterota bacterium]